jgi:acyl-coenzyme A thioesterase PaaI-like protein
VTPNGEPGVSDFGISLGGAAPTPAERAGRPAEAAGEDPRFELAAALRRVTSAMVGRLVADGDIIRATQSVVEVAGLLERVAAPGRRPRAQPDPAGHPQDFFPTSPAIGFANPVSPPVMVEAIDGELRGTASFDYPYEGPPGCVHGGVLAMVFDEMLGAANIVAGFPGMTGTLTIRYRKPTPLRTPLRLEARLADRDGRKVRTCGAIYHGDLLTAEAEGIFIALAPQRFLQIVSEHAESPEVLAQVRADASRLGFANEGLAGPD